MNKNTKDAVVKALNIRIKRLNEFLTWQRNVRDNSERELKAKKGSTQNLGNGFSVDIEYDESTSAQLYKESVTKIEKYEVLLKEAENALEDIKNNY